ncbi:MAG: GIY-YIG nuclease family protein [bacterium]|nr:GIY-YIG nuclease family protein [bacterium]
MYYFYILQSLKNTKLYLGQTKDLKARIKSHNNGENKATKPNIPYELIFYSAFKNEKDAINSEQYFKTTAGWKRLHKMLENTLFKGA